MAIRTKNLDFNRATSTRLMSSVYVGDLTSALQSYPIFIAPYSCEIKGFDVISKQATTLNTSQCLTLEFRYTNNSDATLAKMTGAVTANARTRVSVSGTYTKLTAGQSIEVQVSAVCQALSKVLVTTVYVPLSHRESL